MINEEQQCFFVSFTTSTNTHLSAEHSERAQSEAKTKLSKI